MKKLIVILAAIAVLFFSTALADDLQAMTDEELLALHRDVLNEMERRGLPDDPEADKETAAADCVVSFFACWSQNDLDGMLELCENGWKAGVENPRTELFRILMNRTPQTLEIRTSDEIAGEGPYGLTYCLVTAVSELDRNNGMAPERTLFRLLVRQEEDGLWRISPLALADGEKADEEIPAEATPEPGKPAGADEEDTVLYYNPEGGQYYHLDQNCPVVHEKYKPLQGWFIYSELNEEAYSGLAPCGVCGAPQRP